MKHLFLSIAAMCAAALSGSAQCTADFDFMDAPFGVSPDASLGETFEDAIEGVPYGETIHVMIPSSLADVPGSPLTAGGLDSIAIESVALTDESGAVVLLADIGLALTPNNNGDSPNPNMFIGGGQYCAQLSGTPTVAGVFSASLTTTAYIASPFPGIPSPPIPFAFEGYTLTIAESGCTSVDACNFNENAAADDGSCLYVGDPCDDMNPNTAGDMYVEGCGCEGTCINDTDGDGICDEEEVPGCTNELACNYDEGATDDDMSCLVEGESCDDGNVSTDDDVVTEACVCEGVNGILSHAWSGLELFPNPVKDVLNVKLPEGGVYGLTLTSVSGQTVEATQSSVRGQLAWDVSSLPAGAYLLKVSTSDAWTIRKVMIGSH